LVVLKNQMVPGMVTIFQILILVRLSTMAPLRAGLILLEAMDQHPLLTKLQLLRDL
jgi:hypothetical protein